MSSVASVIFLTAISGGLSAFIAGGFMLLPARRRNALLPHLVSFATGALLGAALLALLPHALESGAGAHGIGIALAGGIIAFFVLEKAVLWRHCHVDACEAVLEREALDDGFVRMRWALPAALAKLVAYKGSIAVDGVSLTVTRVGKGFFESVLIPETLQATTLGAREPGDRVNLEADVMARYVVNALLKK